MGENDPNAKWPAGAFLPNPLGSRNSQERYVQILPSYLGDGSLRLGILHVNPKSRGMSTIQSSDPLKMMLTDYKFLSEPEDMETMKSIFRTYVVRIANELERIDSQYVLVAPTREEIADDEKLEEHIRETFAASFHDQCQLRMGRQSEGAVVNSSGEVYGVNNLVVADASIIPYNVDGNTSGAAYLIGSVIAEEILRNE